MSIDRDIAGLAREVRRLADAATPGPWFVRRTDDPSFMAAYYLTTEVGEGVLDVERWDHPATVVAIALLQDPNVALSPQCVENAEFIAFSRASVPRLCDAFEQALDERTVLADALRTLLTRPGLLGAFKLDETVARAWRLLGNPGDQ